MLSKMDVKDPFPQVAEELVGCMTFGYVSGISCFTGKHLRFGWLNSPGFYCLLAGAIEHVHGSASFDDAVVTLEGLAATVFWAR